MAESENISPGQIEFNLPTSMGALESCSQTLSLKNTLGGHQFVEDNTLGNERIKRTHASGTFDEYTPEGGRNVVVHGDDYTAVFKDKTIVVSGNVTVVIGDSCNLNVTNDLNINVGGNMNVNVKGNVDTRVDGNNFKAVTGDVGLKAGQNYKLNVHADAEETINGAHRHKVLGEEFNSHIAGNKVSYAGGNDTQVIGGSKVTAVPNGPITLAGQSLDTGIQGPINFNCLGEFNFTGSDLNIQKKTWHQNDVDVIGKQQNHSTFEADGKITGYADVFGPSVSLSTHIHPYGGVHGSSTGGPA
jgi:hypothetical protein